MDRNLNTEDVSGKLAFFKRHEVFSAFLVFICLAAYAMGANPFSGETVAPFDRLLQFQGWSAIPGDRTAVHAERSDILDSQLPAWITLKEQIRRGETPLWYPNGAGGQPISLELCNPAFLLFVLVKDNALAYYLTGLAKLIISGFGCFLLLRVFLRWVPSIWGGIVFMLCGFNAAWFFWEHLTTAMWIPWLLWGTVMYLETEDKRWLPVVTIISLMLIFGGFPPVAAFGFYSLGIIVFAWNLSSLLSGYRRRPSHDAGLKHFFIRTVLPFLAAGLAFPMAAITLVPFRDAMSAINLGYRTGGGTHFRGLYDLSLFFSYEAPPEVERTAYVGIAVLLLAMVGIFSAVRSADRNLRRFAFINVFLFVSSASIAFGLLPHGLIRALPVFDSNPWGRTVIVAILALSVLSAAGLDFFASKFRESAVERTRVTPVLAGGLLAAALIGLFVFQFYSQKRLFNGFNAVVPSAWFYPATPSIAYVKERLRPLQSVIADASSYWFAGTLGAYGIPEWFAHSFRTDKEKQVLGELAHNRSKSQTTMVIDGKSIHFDSPLMDKLAIKYLLVSRDVGNRRLLELPELSREEVPPLPHNSWRQHIHIPKDIDAGAIGLSFGTYGAEHAPAHVRMTLYRDTDEKYLLEAYLDRREITEKEWAFFPLPDRTVLNKGGYYLEVSLPGYSGPGSLTAWATKAPVNTGSFLEINGIKTALSLIWKIGYFEDMALAAEKWNMISLENDIIIYDNRQVTNSAYFVKNLTPSAVADFSGLDVKQVSVDRIEIHNSQRAAGWIVLPMRLHPSWKALVDNRPVGYDTYLDMLPAIPVRGPAHVTFRFEPESFHRGLKISLAGLFIFLLFFGYCLKRGNIPSAGSG
jgi:hypothetical protein